MIQAHQSGGRVAARPTRALVGGGCRLQLSQARGWRLCASRHPGLRDPTPGHDGEDNDDPDQGLLCL